MFKYIMSSVLFILVLNMWQTNGKGRIRKSSYQRHVMLR